MSEKTVAAFSHQKTYFRRQASEIRQQADDILQHDRAGLQISVGHLLATCKNVRLVGNRAEVLFARVEQAGYKNPERVRDELAATAWELTVYADLLKVLVDKLGFTAPCFQTGLQARGNLILDSTAPSVKDIIATGEEDSITRQKRDIPNFKMTELMDDDAGITRQKPKEDES